VSLLVVVVSAPARRGRRGPM